jgi:hypothetical protein
MAQNEAISEQSSEKNKWRYVKVGARRITNIIYRELVGFFRCVFYILLTVHHVMILGK